MHVDGIDWFQNKILLRFYSLLLIVRLILIIECAGPNLQPVDNPVCSRLQAMLSYGKYQTSQMTSNILYTSRYNGLNSLAYSPIDDLIIFIEPKSTIHIYNGQSIQLIANVDTTDVVSAASCPSIFSESQHELFFIHETNTDTNLISLRVCEVQFDMASLKFEENLCIGNIEVQLDQPDLRINGFTIKRHHAGTNKSLLFISTEVGIIYSVFETQTGTLFGEPKIMNGTLNEGSIVVSSSDSIYYASKQEHLIYELQVNRNFELHFGKTIKTNAIKHPFGLITDECNHLYIATRSMILIMFVKTLSTIRSVFSKASDLPIVLERLNSTTYVYATIKKNAKNLPSYWAFNFLYFTEGDKMFFTTRNPAIDREKSSNSDDATADNTIFPKLWPLSQIIDSTTDKTKKYIIFYSTVNKSLSSFRNEISDQQEKHDFMNSNTATKNNEQLSIENKSTVLSSSISHSSARNLSNEFDSNQTLIELNSINIPDKINKFIEKKIQSNIYSLQNISSESQAHSQHSTDPVISSDNLQLSFEKEKELSNRTGTYSQDYESKRPLLFDSRLFSNETHNSGEILFTDDDLRDFIEGRPVNLSKTQEMQIQAYLTTQSSFNRNGTSQFTTSKQLPTTVNTFNDIIYTNEQNETRYSHENFTETLSSTVKILNQTRDTKKVLISDDELRSYIADRGNLSKERKTQIMTYLNEQSLSSKDIFSTHSTTPDETSKTDEQVRHDRDNQYTTTHSYIVESIYSDIKDKNKSSDATHTLISNEELQMYLQGRNNFSVAQQARIEAYLAERVALNRSITSNYTNNASTVSTLTYTSDSNESYNQDSTMSFSHDELKSFIGNYGNLSKIRQDQIRNYLSQRSPYYHSILSTYRTTSKSLYDNNITENKRSTEYQIKDEELPDNTTKTSIFDPKLYNHTVYSNAIDFTDDDLRSFLENRLNLSAGQKAQIETYLSQSSLTNRNFTLKYPNTPKPQVPIDQNQKERNTNHENAQTKDQKIKSERPILYSEDTNQMMDTNNIVFSEDDLRSFLQDRANLSDNQKNNIEVYLNKKKSYISSTSIAENYRTNKPSFHSNTFTHTPNIEGISFSDDELKSYQEGRANLSKTEELQIQTYLNRLASSHQSIPSSNITTTKVFNKIHSSDDKLYSEHENEFISMQRYDSTMSIEYATIVNRTLNPYSIVFTDDDLRSLLEGRANLSVNQKTQIETYLSQSSLTNRNFTLKYPSSTGVSNKMLSANRSEDYDFDTKNTSFQSLFTKTPLTDTTDVTHTAKITRITFSTDDLRELLEDRENLSQVQENRFETYLKEQKLSNLTRSHFNTSSATPTIVTNLPSENINHHEHGKGNIQFEDDQRNALTTDSDDFHQAIDAEEIKFSDDDLRYFLNDRMNLTESQKLQIESYLRKPSPITTKPATRIHAYDDSEDSHPEEQDSKNFNRTLRIQGITFFDEDLRAFVQDRANLSKHQKTQIQIILNKQLISNGNSSITDAMITTIPTKTSYTDENTYPHDGNVINYSQSYPTRIPLSDLKTSNASTEFESVTFSDGEIQEYLEGRSNFSLIQEAQIQGYLSRKISSNRNILSKYYTSTSTTTTAETVSITQDDSQTTSGKQTNTSSIDSNVLLYPDSLSEDFNTMSSTVIMSQSTLNNFSSIKIHKYVRTTSSPDSRTLIDDRSKDFDESVEKHPDISINPNYDKSVSSDASHKYLKSSTSTKRSVLDGNNKYYNYDNGIELFYSSRSAPRPLTSSSTHARITTYSPLKDYLKTIHSNQNFKANHSRDRLVSSTSPSADLAKDGSNLNLIRSTSYFDNSDEDLTFQYDTATVNLSIFSTRFKSTKEPRFSSIYSQELLSVDVEDLSTDEMSKSLTKFPIDLNTRQTPRESIIASDNNTLDTNVVPFLTHQFDKQLTFNQSQISSSRSIQPFTSPSKLKDLIRLQKQSSINDTKILNDTVIDDLDEQIKISRNKIFDNKQTSTLSTLITNDTWVQMQASNYLNQNIKDGIENENSSAISVGFNVSYTLPPLSPFVISSTTPLSPDHSPLLSASHYSHASSSTSSANSSIFSSSKLFSDTEAAVRRKITTAMPLYSTVFPTSASISSLFYKHSAMQTTEEPMEFDRIQLTSTTTSSQLITSGPYSTEAISSTSSVNTNELSSATTFDPYITSQVTSTTIESSSTEYIQSTDSYSTNFESLPTTLVSSTSLDSSSILTISDEISVHSTLATTNEENRLLFKSKLSTQTSTIQSSTIAIDNAQQLSTPSEFVFTSSPLFYTSTILTTLEHSSVDETYPSSQVSLLLRTLITYSPTTTSTTHQHITEKPQVSTVTIEPLSITSSSTESTTLLLNSTTLKNDYELLTSTQTLADTLEWTTVGSESVNVLKPLPMKNNSYTALSNDLLNQLVNNLSTSTNSSTEKLILINLVDLPLSSWNLSLNSNESIVLDFVLPSSANSNGTTNLTFTNMEANSLSTNIVGAPLNIHVDRVQTKQFSLKVNATDDDLNSNRIKPSLSDVAIGYVKSEHFELSLTKIDNMNVRVRQVDSATADLFLDNNFCSNESSFDINLNLSRNGTIRYGNRNPIRIGPVFTRVHMLNQLCEREQPLTLFFDICERQNPCLNSGTCVSLIPNYEHESYVPSELGDTGYKCNCPLHASGEHCQLLDYPLGYCLNGGTLFQLYDRYNKSIEQCICSTGFLGEHCEENIDDCIGITCSAHGICEDAVDRYTCVCYDGFFGFNCERKHVQTILLQAVSRSFGIVAILLIVAIACLVVASDIHTYVTSKQKAYTRQNMMSIVTSELFENSVLLLGFSDAPIEMTDLSNIRSVRKSGSVRQHHTNRKTRKRLPAGYEHISRRKALRIGSKISSRRYIASRKFNHPII